MRYAVIGWLIWFLATATLVLILLSADKGVKRSAGSGTTRPVEYQLYMD